MAIQNMRQNCLSKYENDETWKDTNRLMEDQAEVIQNGYAVNTKNYTDS